MTPVTSSTLAQRTSKTLCYYFNSTRRMQLIRLWNGRSYGWEKIISLGDGAFAPASRSDFEAKASVSLADLKSAGSHRFPQQRILFEAEPENIVEVHTKKEGKQLLESIFTCDNLQVNRDLPQLVLS